MSVSHVDVEESSWMIEFRPLLYDQGDNRDVHFTANYSAACLPLTPVLVPLTLFYFPASNTSRSRRISVSTVKGFSTKPVPGGMDPLLANAPSV